MALWRPVTGTGAVEVELVANKNGRSSNPNAFAGSSSTRNRLTGHSVYLIQPSFEDSLSDLKISP